MIDPASGLAEVERRLVDAAQQGDLEASVARWLAAESFSPQCVERLQAVSSACAAIRAHNHADEAALRTAFAAASIPVVTGADPHSGRPVRYVALVVGSGDRATALAVMQDAGYRPIAPSSAGAWESYQHTLPSASFVPVDGGSSRVELRWRSGAGRPGHRLLHPDSDDWAAVDLPRRWWPLYHLVHLARLPWRAARRGRTAPHLGPFLTTPTSMIDALVDLAEVGSDDLLIDLGCGDGRIVIQAAQRLGCRARGIEIDPELAREARAGVAAAGLEARVEIIEGDAQSADLAGAAAVIAFLPVNVVERLLQPVLAGMAPGARFVTHELEPFSPPLPPTTERVLATADAISVARCWVR